ncbi:MAG: VCBS repeat-containing protein, partial [Bacteroidales bacterium]|nr:VCBS repeat-containing protein [Bacteroidales bacterium]
SRHTGIDFKNTIVETDSLNVMEYEYIYNGAGVGIGDLNNDGLQDIIFAGNQVSTRVYLNLGNFKFKDITSNFAGLTNDQWYSGVTVVDINSDGLPDVYLTSTANDNPQKRKNRLWVNNGTKNGIDPTFTEMAEKYGIADDGHSVDAAFFDYDGDGNLDLYILNNILNQRMNTAYRAKLVDGSALNSDKLYHNNGNGTFSDVTRQAGIVYEGFGLGLALGDVNKDGYPDIYVSNDYISNDLFYINQGDGTFRNEIRKYMSYQSKSSMGNDMTDVNNDGNPDMFTLDMMPESYYKKKQTINGFSYIFYINDEKFGYEHQYLRNMLHLHNGFMNGEMLPYSETGQMMGIYQTDWSWSPLFADYDNDGDKDLIITNGYPRDLTDKDWTRFKAMASGYYSTDQPVIEMAPAVKIPNNAFENTGDLRFIKRTEEWLGATPSYSYGASFVDLDNDGDLDYVVNNINDEAFIFRNYTSEKSKKRANFIKIRLKGTECNTMAIGAKIELWGNGNYQFTENFLTRGYATSDDPTSHFGLGREVSIDSIKVTWPASNNTSILRNVGANQTIEINEMNSRPSHEDVKTLRKNDLLFNKRENVINYVHEQTDYIDFFYDQTIIPHKFSQIGPCIAKGDINNDGHEDLIIGSTNKLPTTVLLRKGNGFEEAKFEGLTTQKEFSESDLAILDIDGDGDKDVVAIAGGYENKEESEYIHYLYENRNGSFIRTTLPIPPFPASVVRPFDFDHDGDIDLFVGSRVKKGMFPYANHSWLIHNNKGKLSVDSTSRLNLGMVTDAIWTDYDKDGWEDLLVAREWNSLVILKNMNGKELIPQNIPALEGQHGIWYSLIAGDFDQDGDDDYIVGNLGDNHRFNVSDQYPLNLYAIDLDMDGIIDPLTTAYWNDKNGKMKEYPINYLDELWAQSSFFQKKFKDYASFSFTSIDDILDENILKRLEFKLHANTTSSYILWNDNDKFRWEKLPKALQVAPIRKMIVEDFNGDNFPDMLVSGNDYTYDIATGYYDANKGILLLNNGNKQEKGKPSFEVLAPSQSGLLLQGMVESLLYFKGDTSLIVAGINRAKVAVFEHTHAIPF